MSATQSITSREAYHAVRRAVTPYRPHYREHQSRVPAGHYWPQTEWQKQVRSTLRSLFDRKTLRPEQAQLADRLQAALTLRNAALLAQPGAALADRAREYRRLKYVAEIGRRGLPTVLDLGKAGAESLSIVDERVINGYRVALLHAEGWKEYSRAFGRWHQTLSILCGRDDAGLWAVRIPGTVTGVGAALQWLKPAVVRRAEEAGKRVLRQGDVWLIERRRDDMTALPAGHRWDGAARVLSHGEHEAVHVPFPALAVPQSTLAWNGSQRRRGD